MRGISIPHGPLPVILLNTSDSPHGRIFTLLHEFAHILLTNGGHETSALEGRKRAEDQLLEKVSNRFAAAALMPRQEFLVEALRYPAALDGDEDALRKLAYRRIKASPEAILRRLVVLGKARPGTYRFKRKGWQERSWYAPPQGEGGPPYEVRVIASAGRPFVSLVLDGYRRNVVSSSDVSDYLGMQLKYLDRVARQLAPGPGHRRRRSKAWLSAWIPAVGSTGGGETIRQTCFRLSGLEIEALVDEGEIIASEEVYVELAKKDDELHEWIQARKSMLIPPEEQV